jgi:hypothetical protein
MDATDPRHGTEAGMMAHRRDNEPGCTPCIHARMVAAKRRRLYGSSKVPALGSQRRIQALQALGWSRLVIANRLGYTHNGAISYLMRAETMLPDTAARIAAVYDELSMTVPTGAGPARARTWAKRLGFVPPLAWDAIDDPNETPSRLEYVAPTRLELVTELQAEEADYGTALQRLGLNHNALEKWCDNNGHRAWFNHINREHMARNGRYCVPCQQSIRARDHHWCGVTREHVSRFVGAA